MLCFTFCFFGHEECEILVPWPRIEPASPALEGKVLITVAFLSYLLRELSAQPLMEAVVWAWDKRWELGGSFHWPHPLPK